MGWVFFLGCFLPPPPPPRAGAAIVVNNIIYVFYEKLGHFENK
jgi:hypothetical protein